MLAWEQITPALTSLFSDLAFTGVQPRFEAQWHDRARKFTHPGTQTDLLLQVTSIREPVGEDAVTYESVITDHGERLDEAVQGDRYITLNVRVESLDHSDRNWAWSTVERIRTRLKRTSSRERLRAVNMGLVQVLNSTGLPAPRDGRIASVASMDVLLVGRSCDVDASGALGWIERVELTGMVTSDAWQLPDNTLTVAPFDD